MIGAAYHGQSSWAKRTAEERCRILMRWHDLINHNIDNLSATLTAEQGKPLAEARAEIVYANSFILWFAGEASRAYGLTIPSPFPDARVQAVKEPVGVVAAITPWNFPAAMVTRKVAPAMAAGCSIIVKPSDLTPLTAIALSKLAYKAGVPQDVFSIVVSDNAEAVGKILTTDPGISKISFTGSSRVGGILMAQSAPTIKRLSLELGGNAPFIVFSDACIETAIQSAKVAKFRNAGQTCVSANRFIVERSIASLFAERLAAEAKSLHLGDGRDHGCDIGPLINVAAANRVRSMIAEAVKCGASIVEDSAPSHVPQFVAPVVVENVTPEMRLFTEEIFGPVSPVTAFDSEEEAVSLANATPFGLAGYFFSSDQGRIARTIKKMQCGMVGINTGTISNAAIPFGGCKQSGLGREGSAYGLDEYLEIKTLIEAI